MTAAAQTMPDATPVTPLHAYRRTANRLRHFNRMRRWPAGFVCTGDAVCTLNPVYGQGMTTAARSAETLEQFLSKRSHRSGLVDEATGPLADGELDRAERWGAGLSRLITGESAVPAGARRKPRRGRLAALPSVRHRIRAAISPSLPATTP